MSSIFFVLATINDVCYGLMQKFVIGDDWFRPLWDNFCQDVVSTARKHPSELVLVIIRDGTAKDVYLGILDSAQSSEERFLSAARYVQSRNLYAYPISIGESPADFEYVLRLAVKNLYGDESPFEIIIGNVAVERWFHEGDGRYAPYLRESMLKKLGYAFPNHTHPLF